MPMTDNPLRQNVTEGGSESFLPQVIPYGETAVLVNFEQRIHPLINQQVLALDRWLDHAPVPGILEKIPSYASLLVYYNPTIISVAEVMHWIKSGWVSMPNEVSPVTSNLIQVPVAYGGEAGLDLDYVAGLHALSPQEVINIHTSVEYTVAMMGFTPGFVYLLGMDNRLVTPRRAAPRTQVPAGAVGIAGAQTGIYSIESPGGWQLIGKTPLALFDPHYQAPFRFSPGDRIKFVPVSEKGI